MGPKSGRAGSLPHPVVDGLSQGVSIVHSGDRDRLKVRSAGRIAGSERSELRLCQLKAASGHRTGALLLVAKLVANSPYGQNHLRILWVVLNFGPQPIDM